MDNAYVLSMREHLSTVRAELEGLTEISAQRSLNRYEYRAAERTLQMLIEACIGIAKHWNYALNKAVAADAYSAFERLEQHGCEAVSKVEWRKIIGMRNALVHDYLNIEAAIIKAAIETRLFAALFDFADEGLGPLSVLYSSKE